MNKMKNLLPDDQLYMYRTKLNLICIKINFTVWFISVVIEAVSVYSRKYKNKFLEHIT